MERRTHDGRQDSQKSRSALSPRPPNTLLGSVRVQFHKAREQRDAEPHMYRDSGRARTQARTQATDPRESARRRVLENIRLRQLR
jgi:hypothetical protein